MDPWFGLLSGLLGAGGLLATGIVIRNRLVAGAPPRPRSDAKAAADKRREELSK